MGGQPSNMIMLTGDAFGVLPPIARLTPAQAMYHFLSGYTAKVAGTERGITEPTATFSAASARPSWPCTRPSTPTCSASGSRRTTWTAGWSTPAGPAAPTARASASGSPTPGRWCARRTSGELAGVELTRDPVFGFDVPRHCPGVPDQVLRPRDTWSDPAAYDAKADELAKLFTANFAEYADQVTPEVRAAAPTHVTIGPGDRAAQDGSMAWSPDSWRPSCSSARSIDPRRWPIAGGRRGGCWSRAPSRARHLRLRRVPLCRLRGQGVRGPGDRRSRMPLVRGEPCPL